MIVELNAMQQRSDILGEVRFLPFSVNRYHDAMMVDNGSAGDYTLK